jgi:hypothetical protein
MPKKLTALMILDGFGEGKENKCNAITLSGVPVITALKQTYPHTVLGASGIAVGLPLKLSGMSIAKVLWISFATGMPTAVGSILGTAVGCISREMIALCISFAGGAMLYISLKELIPAAGKKNKAFYALIGICLGFILTTIV